MTSPVSSIRNLGPAYEESCAKIGINSAEKLREVGADETYRRLLQAGTKPHFIGYYVLVMALQGRPWNDCKGDEKKKNGLFLMQSRLKPSMKVTVHLSK